MNTTETTLLMTRPCEASTRFVADLVAETGPFAQVLISPLIEIVPVDVPLDVDPQTTLLFTSEQGVRAAARLSPPQGHAAFCVGDRTATAAAELGYSARSAGGAVDDLLHMILQDGRSGPFLHVTGRHVQGDLVGGLRAAGRDAQTVVAYDQVPRALSGDAQRALMGASPVLAPLLSPRTATLFAEVAKAATAPLHLAAISPATAAPLRQITAVDLEIAEAPNAAALRAAVIRLLARTAHA